MAKVIFAGAGTAGHVEPALAVAEWLRINRPEVESLFLGTAEGVENTLVPAAHFPLALIEKAPFPRKLNADLFRWPRRFARTRRETRALIAGADLVVGFGGYVAAPAYLAAKKARIPIIAHEANAKMGMANKLAIRCGATMLRAFGDEAQQPVGIPLRQSIVEVAGLLPEGRARLKREVRISLNLDPEAPTILVFGGSLGSMKFNETIGQVQREISAKGLQIIHAVGSKNLLPKAQAGYLPLPYIDDMARAYAAADLVIARSGAVTVVETAVLGLYSLYVPLPIGNGEQAYNAQFVVERGGGEMISNEEFSSDWLRNNISRLIECAQMWNESGTPIDLPLDASEKIGREILKVLAHG